MKTLNRQITGTILGSSATFHAIRERWRANRSGWASPTHYLFYLALRGKDWRRAFGPIRNQNKIQNGGLYNWGLEYAVAELHSDRAAAALLAPYDGLVTEEMLATIRRLIPRFVPAAYPPESFHSLATFPVEAYKDDVVTSLLPHSASDAAVTLPAVLAAAA